jgi:diguanylate cyclase (GGDEF)-like protein/PAS domain S-box-containing protein
MSTAPVIEQDTLYHDILDQITDGVYLVDPSWRIIYWNRAAERITGYAADEVLGARCSDNILIHIDGTGCNLCKTGCPLRHCVSDGQPRTMEIFLHHKEGHRVPVRVRAAPLRDRFGRLFGVIETFQDTSQQLAAVSRIHRLERLAYLDALTGIPNRRFAEMTLEAHIEDYARRRLPFGVLICDIDHFKRLNDTYGHEIGDRVLKMVAQTVSHNLRSCDLVGRWGGEEFLVVLDAGDDGGIARQAERMRILVSRSAIHFGERMLGATISIGASRVQPGDTTASLLARADKMLYRSKAEGRDRVNVG